MKLENEDIKSYLFDYKDYKHHFERFYHAEFTEKCGEVFVISKESHRTFEILERFVSKDAEFDFNGAPAVSSLDSVLK